MPPEEKMDLEISHKGLRGKIERAETSLRDVRTQIKEIGKTGSSHASTIGVITKGIGLTASEIAWTHGEGRVNYDRVRTTLLWKVVSGHLQEHAPLPDPRVTIALLSQKRYNRPAPIIHSQALLHVIYGAFGRNPASFPEISKALRTHKLAKHIPSLRMTETQLAGRINLLTGAGLLHGPDLHEGKPSAYATFNLTNMALGG
ncbi:MAG: hypothetical protein V1787_05475 [Candidatus Micrarchaeota archaeon]